MCTRYTIIYSIFSLFVIIQTSLAQERCGIATCRHGDCENTQLSFVCHCPYGIKGTKCDLFLRPGENPCLSNPCWSGGTCTPDANNIDWKCDCPPGYGGIQCRSTSDFNICFKNNPCKNNGVCILTTLTGVDYKCSCTGYWTGKNCETEIPLCERPNPCNNEGICENNICVCTRNFTGSTCETFAPPDQIVKVFNKGGYVLDLELRYELPVVTATGEESYVSIVKRGSTILGRDFVFSIPYNVLLTGNKGVFLRAHAVAGIDIFFQQILRDPQCYHVWGTTLIPYWTPMPCW